MSAVQVPFTSTMIFTPGPTASRTARTLATASLSDVAGKDARSFSARWPCFTSFAAD